MGLSISAQITPLEKKEKGHSCHRSVQQMHDQFNENQSSLESHVFHYSPPQFPMRPEVTKTVIAYCKESWGFIMEPIVVDGVTVCGLTAFYTDFYEMLEIFDKQGKFESILLQHTSGLNAASVKGAILIRIMNFALSLDPDNVEKTRYALYMLGKSHNNRRIRPWQYSTFIQCLISALSSRLGPRATSEVMGAWVNLFAFILQNILSVAIKGLVNEAELEINVSDEVSSAEITDELARMQEAKNMEKKLNKARVRSSTNSQPASKFGSTKNSRSNSFVSLYQNSPPDDMEDLESIRR